MAVVLALASALVWGAADFCGGLATRRAAAMSVVVVSHAAGLVGLLLVLTRLGGDPTFTDLGWGGLAGTAGAAGLVVFYRALAGGVMSVVAPVTALTAAAVPVLAGLALGERLSGWSAVGILLALVAVTLVAAESGLSALRAVRPTSLGPALVAGTAFGLFFVAIDRADPAAGLWPLVGSRAVSIALVGAAVLATRTSLRGALAQWPLVLVAGAGDMAANALFLLAAQQGQLAITGVLASLYPVSTVVLAQLVLRERLVGTQLAGLASAAAAVVLIALPG